MSNTYRFTASFKDDISKIADLKQQMSRKMILLRGTVIFWRCAAK